MLDKVRVSIQKPTGSGGRIGWNKLVTRVDATQRDGFAFVGTFLGERQVDLIVGDVLVGKIPIGSARTGYHWRVGVVTTNGVEWEDRTWPLHQFLDFRDHVERLLTGGERDIEALKRERTRLLERVRVLDRLIGQDR